MPINLKIYYQKKRTLQKMTKKEESKKVVPTLSPNLKHSVTTQSKINISIVL